MLLLRARLPAHTQAHAPAPHPTRRERRCWGGHPATGGPVPGEERCLAATQIHLTELCFLQEPGQRQRERIPLCCPAQLRQPPALKGDRYNPLPRAGATAFCAQGQSRSRDCHLLADGAQASSGSSATALPGVKASTRVTHCSLHFHRSTLNEIFPALR